MARFIHVLSPLFWLACIIAPISAQGISATASATIAAGTSISTPSETIVTTSSAVITSPTTVVTLTSGNENANTLSATTSVAGDTVSAQDTVYVVDTNNKDSTNDTLTITANSSQYSDANRIKTEVPIIKDAIKALKRATRNIQSKPQPQPTETVVSSLLHKLMQPFSSPSISHDTSVSISKLALNVPEGHTSTISLAGGNDKAFLVNSTGDINHITCTKQCKVLLIKDLSNDTTHIAHKPLVITIDNT